MDCVHFMKERRCRDDCGIFNCHAGFQLTDTVLPIRLTTFRSCFLDVRNKKGASIGLERGEISLENLSGTSVIVEIETRDFSFALLTFVECKRISSGLG